VVGPRHRAVVVGGIFSLVNIRFRDGKMRHASTFQRTVHAMTTAEPPFSGLVSFRQNATDLRQEPDAPDASCRGRSTIIAISIIG
jgi:hypothetical protein